MRMQFGSLASLSGLRIGHCHELWRRSQTWLRCCVAWLWCRPASTAPIRPLAWGLPHAVSVALKRQKKNKNKNKNKKPWGEDLYLAQSHCLCPRSAVPVPACGVCLGHNHSWVAVGCHYHCQVTPVFVCVLGPVKGVWSPELTVLFEGRTPSH